MSSERSITLSPEAQQIKKASRDLIRAYGGQAAAAELLHSRQQRMSDCGLPNTTDFLRLDEVAELEDVTHGFPGHPHVTARLAARQGYALVKLAQEMPGEADLLKLLADKAQASGQISRALLEAIADRVIDRVEAREVAALVDDLVAIGVAMRAALQTIIRTGRIDL